MPPRIIFEDGVVASGSGESDEILSCRTGDCITVGEFGLLAQRDVWGEWDQNGYREIRLRLTVNGRQVLEGGENTEASFFSFARKLTRRRRSLAGDIGILLFNLAAAHVHLRSLLRSYAQLTSVFGPQLPLDQSPVLSINFPEPYLQFDACLSSLRAFADSARFIIWRVLGRSTGLPRSLQKLASTDLPPRVLRVVQNYIETSVSGLTEYRDNAIHYAPPGAHMAPVLLWSKRVIHAQVWLPANPAARSLKKFRYYQRDAFRYARSLLEQSYSFCDELFPLLDERQRKDIRGRRSTTQKAVPNSNC